MAIEFEPYLAPGYVRADCTGEYSNSEFLRVIDETLDTAILEGRDGALVDFSAVTGAPDVLGRFETGEGVARIQLGKDKLVAIAVVGKQPLIDPDRLGETVAINRCAVGKAFEDPDEALARLKHQR